MMISVFFAIISFFVVETTFKSIGLTLGDMFDKPIIFLYCIVFLICLFGGISKWKNQKTAAVLLSCMVAFLTLANYVTMRFNNKFFAFSDIIYFGDKVEIVSMFINRMYSPLLLSVMGSTLLYVVLSLMYRETINICSVECLGDYPSNFYYILYDEKHCGKINSSSKVMEKQIIDLRYNKDIDILAEIKNIAHKFDNTMVNIGGAIGNREAKKKKIFFSSNKWAIVTLSMAFTLCQFIFSPGSFYFSNLMSSYKAFSIDTRENDVYKMFGVPYDNYDVKNDDFVYGNLDKEIDIVVIQNETFFDFAKVEDLNFSTEITKNFRKYQKEGLWGRSFVPVIGGMTCNSEFEFLTGMRIKDMYNYQIPYEEAPLMEINSLPWDFKKYGFITKAIHGYKRDFFRRDKFYPTLGLDEFIAEDDFEDPLYYGAWMSDESMYNRILEELEEGGNQFIYAVTVQNHGPFSYKAPKDLVEVENLTDEDKVSLENYAAGLKISDDALEVFMEALRERDRETIVVFYGDHIFSTEHEMISSNKYFTSNPNNKYATDYFMWSSKGNIATNKEDMSLMALSRHLKKQVLPSTYFDEFILKNYSTEAAYFGEADTFTQEAYSTVVNRVYTNSQIKFDPIYMEIKN